MAASHTHSSNTTGYSNRLSAASHALFGALYTWNDNRQTRKSLGKLSDHQLNDIGFCRGDLDNLSN